MSQKPREFTNVSIIEWHDNTGTERQDYFGRKDKLHVIEKSAYDAAVAERDALKAENERLKAEVEQFEYDLEIADSRAAFERDQLREDLDAAVTALEAICWSWDNDAGRQCSDIAEDALASIKARREQKAAEWADNSPIQLSTRGVWTSDGEDNR